MIYGYTVKKDGVLYRAGEDVPETKNEKIMETEASYGEKPARRGRPKNTEE